MEAEFIRWLRERLPAHPRLLLGPGDDAAILQISRDKACVVTSDMLQEGIDFSLEADDHSLIGRKSLAVNLSDLAAMGAEPLAALVSLALPREKALAIAQRLYAGILPLAEQFDISIAGGDTGTWDGPLVVSVTAIGEVDVRGALTRSGACPGDAIIVTGAFGGSILGHHLRFMPRVREIRELMSSYAIHAATDVSDGLSLDLWHILQESGCGADVHVEQVPISDAALRLARQHADGRSALEHALSDGEDFELILAVPPQEADRLLQNQPLDVRVTQIGNFTSEQGLWQRTADGQRKPLRPEGYEH